MTGFLFTKLIMPGMNKQDLRYVISFEQLKKIKEVCFIRESIFPFFLLRHSCNWKYNNGGTVESNSDSVRTKAISARVK